MNNLEHKKRIIIKIGSSLLVENSTNSLQNLQPRLNWLQTVAQDIAYLKKQGKQVIIVSSGAIALGKTRLITKNNKLTLAQKQAAAAIGQIALMAHYKNCFASLNLDIAQILISGEDTTNRSRYLNSKNTINTLLENDVIPIVNENDTVAVAEIKIGDNDRLAARIAQITSADLLILLSDIDGLYQQNPKQFPKAKFIPLVLNVDKEIETMAGESGSNVGTGGMITKIKAVKMAFNSACDCIIASGIANHPINNIFSGGKFTFFSSPTKKINAKKQWLADCLNPKGEIIANKSACQALKNNASLLPVGVVKIIGEFKKGEVVLIMDEQGNHLGNGICNCSSTAARLIIGKSRQIELIHRDNLFIKEN